MRATCTVTQQLTSNRFLFAHVVSFVWARGIVPFIMDGFSRIRIKFDAIFCPALVVWLTRAPIFEIEFTSIGPLEAISIPLCTNPWFVGGWRILKTADEYHFIIRQDWCQVSILLNACFLCFIPVLLYEAKSVAIVLKHCPTIFAASCKIKQEEISGLNLHF